MMALRRVPDRDRGRIIDRLTMTLGIRWLNEIQGDQLSDGAFAMLLQPLIDDPKLRFSTVKVRRTAGGVLSGAPSPRPIAPGHPGRSCGHGITAGAALGAGWAAAR